MLFSVGSVCSVCSFSTHSEILTEKHLQKNLMYGTTQTLLGGLMNKIIDLVGLSFKNSHKYFEQSIVIQHIKENLTSTLTENQATLFNELLEQIYKFHKLDVDEHILHTYKVCKDVFELR